MKSQVSIPLPEKAGGGGGVGRNPVLLSLLWVILTGNTIPSPHLRAVPAVNNTLRGRRAGLRVQSSQKA